MAKSLSQVNVERGVEEGQGYQVPDDDVELAFRMAVEMLDQGGIKVIEDAINQSADPAQVVGQFLAQLIGQMAEQLRDEFDIDPKIFLAKNGWLDMILDYIEVQLGYPQDFSDEIYQQVLEVIKAAASGPEAPNNVMDPSLDSRPSALPPQAAMPEATDPAALPSQPGV